MILNENHLLTKIDNLPFSIIILSTRLIKNNKILIELFPKYIKYMEIFDIYQNINFIFLKMQELILSKMYLNIQNTRILQNILMLMNYS